VSIVISRKKNPQKFPAETEAVGKERREEVAGNYVSSNSSRSPTLDLQQNMVILPVTLDRVSDS